MIAPLRTLIVDDEPLAVERLQILCARLEHVDVVGTAMDGEAALRLIPAIKPDVLLLDVAMPGLDGLHLAKALADAGDTVAIVFITAFDQFAVSAFEVAAVDYLLKPVSQERLEQALLRVRDRMASPPRAQTSWAEEFWVPHRSGMMRILAKEIELIEAERDYMRLHVGTQSFLLHRTISELDRQLDPNIFVRLHRSTIVARDQIVGFDRNGEGSWTAMLRGGRSARVGRSYLAAARAITGR